METLGLLKLPPYFFNSSQNPMNRNHPNSHSVHSIRCRWFYPRRSHFHSSSCSSSSSDSCRFWDLRVKFSLREEWVEDDDEEGMGFGWREEKGKRRRWWDEDDDDSLDLDEEEGSGLLEQAFDSIWIFKVFKSFGWMLPAIIISLLIENGPKAFLMALALPLGQSILFFAIDKLFGRTRERPKPRTRSKKKPFSWATSNFQGMRKEEEEKEEDHWATKKRPGYQSWVATEEGSVKEGDKHRSSFGGWDELDRRQGPKKQPKRQPPRATGDPSGLGMEMGRFSRRRRHRDTPLLLRLLIAVFPFLGSWTKFL